MKKCINCGNLSDDNALFCSKCGFNLDIDNNYEEEKENNDNTKKDKRGKIKTKTKVKKKIKKVKEKDKNNKKSKNDKKNQKVIIKKERTIGQTIFTYFMVFLSFILFCLLLVAGYYILNNEVVKVPNVTNINYIDAERKLLKSNLRVNKNYIDTSEENLNDIVLSQSISPEKKVRKNKVVVLNIGKFDNTYYLDDFSNMNIESVKKILDKNNLKYNIVKKESDLEDNIVISQVPNKGTKMKKNDIVKLIISKQKKQKIKKSENNMVDIEEQKETNEKNVEINETETEE